MNQEQVLAWALEAGGVIYEVDWCFEIENLERFAALVAAHEREACAKVCEEVLGENNVSAAIRARSTNLCQNSTKLVEKRGRAGSFGE